MNESYAIDFDSVNDSNQYRNISINDSVGNQYIYAVNLEASDSLLFKKENDSFVYVGENDDYSLDGMYLISSIRKENYKMLSISTIFGGAGGQRIKYFVNVKEGLPHIAATIILNPISPDIQQRCIQPKQNEQEQLCLTEPAYTEKEQYENNLYRGVGLMTQKQFLYKTSDEKSITHGYLIKNDKVVIFDEKSSPEGHKWCHIGFKGKKDIFAWVPCTSIQLTNE